MHEQQINKVKHIHVTSTDTPYSVFICLSLSLSFFHLTPVVNIILELANLNCKTLYSRVKEKRETTNSDLLQRYSSHVMQDSF